MDGNANKFCVFRVFDIDHNGFVDFREYMLASGVIVGSTPDVDGNGIG